MEAIQAADLIHLKTQYSRILLSVVQGLIGKRVIALNIRRAILDIHSLGLRAIPYPMLGGLKADIG